MNRYDTKCPYWKVKCPYMDDPTDRCTWNSNCLRDDVIERMIKIEKQEKKKKK